MPPFFISFSSWCFFFLPFSFLASCQHHIWKQTRTLTEEDEDGEFSGSWLGGKHLIQNEGFLLLLQLKKE